MRAPPPRLTPRIQEQMRRGSARLVESIARRYGRELEMVIGCGYPKSGTVWLCKLLSSYLGAPYPQNYLLPVAMRSVIHAHWDYHANLPSTAYIVRDGRDTMVSMYFHQLRTLQEGRRPRAAQIVAQRFERAFGAGFDPRDVRGNLPRFIEIELERPASGRRTWHEHVSAWTAHNHHNVTSVRYEDLLAEPEPTLSGLLTRLVGEPADPELVRLAVRRQDFTVVTGRQRGAEDRMSFQRKGVVGDWKNYFTRESAEIFDAAAGETLLLHEYVESRRWTESV